MDSTLSEVFGGLSIPITEAQGNALQRYYDLLIKWNSVHNLTAITEWREVVIKHFADSVLPANAFPTGASVLDIGAGAGFPSVPLKIMRNDLRVTMLDSLNKRVTFLQEVISELGLTDITAVHSRAEDALSLRGSFSCVTARAVAPLNTLLEYCLPYVRVGGLAVLYKGAGAETELSEATVALKLLGGKLRKVLRFNLDEAGERNVIIVEKIAPTPSKYPRTGNKPRLKPLK